MAAGYDPLGLNAPAGGTPTGQSLGMANPTAPQMSTGLQLSDPRKHDPRKTSMANNQFDMGSIDPSSMQDILQLVNLQTNFKQGGGAGPTRAGQDIKGNDLVGGVTQLPGGYEALTPEGFKQSGEAVQSYTREQGRDFHKQMALLAAAAVGGAALSPGGFSLTPAAEGAGAAAGAADVGSKALVKGLGGVAKGATGAAKGAGIVSGTKAGAGIGANILSGLKGATGGDDVGILDRIGNIFGKIGGGGDDASLFDKILGGLTVAGGLGAAGGGNDLSDLLGLTNRDLNNQLKGAEFNAPNATLPGGVGGQYDASTNTYSSTLGDLNPIRKMLLGSAANEGTDPVIQKALRDFGLGGFDDAATVEQQQLDLLRQRAQPENQRTANALAQRLFSKGQLGENSTVTGEALRGLSEAESQQDLGFQLAARELGQSTQKQRFEQSMKALGLGDQLQGSALQRLLGASGGAQDITKLGALPIEMMLALGAARSNSANAVGTNLVSSSAGQNSIGDLLGLFARSGGTG